MNVERKKYCVNGEWLESKTQTYMPVTDSSTGEVIAEVPCCTKKTRWNQPLQQHRAHFPSGQLFLSVKEHR